MRQKVKQSKPIWAADVSVGVALSTTQPPASGCSPQTIIHPSSLPPQLSQASIFLFCCIVLFKLPFFQLHFIPSPNLNMKTAAIVAATALVGGAAAGKHKMKLKKIPIDEQLKGATMHDFTRQLGQKYLSHTPRDFHIMDMFAPASVGTTKGGHKVPVTNYMNAQCMFCC